MDRSITPNRSARSVFFALFRLHWSIYAYVSIRVYIHGPAYDYHSRMIIQTMWTLCLLPYMCIYILSRRCSLPRVPSCRQVSVHHLFSYVPISYAAAASRDLVGGTEGIRVEKTWLSRSSIRQIGNDDWSLEPRLGPQETYLKIKIQDPRSIQQGSSARGSRAKSSPWIGMNDHCGTRVFFQTNSSYPIYLDFFFYHF